MYTLTKGLLLILLLATLIVSCGTKSDNIDVGRPVITGSPILVLNQ